MAEARELYLNLMKRALVGLLCDGDKTFRPLNTAHPRRFHKRLALNFISQYLARTGKQIMEPVPSDLNRRLLGLEWPSPAARTMIGVKRLDNIQACVEEVLKNGAPGDLIETGVRRGGAEIRATVDCVRVRDACAPARRPALDAGT